MVAQWEVAAALTSPPHTVVGPLASAAYLDSDEVWKVASKVFAVHGVVDVISVAQPILHHRKTARLIRGDGFRLFKVPMGRIGFDASRRNTQWWTKGPARLCVYALMQALTGRRGPWQG